MERVSVAGVTEVLIGHGLPSPLLPERADRGRVAILTQPGSTSLALDIAGSLISDGLKPEVIGLPDRDAAKTLDVATSVYETLRGFGLGRSDAVMGVGGGSVTDLAGFVAGTWLRGVEAVHVPTTLLGAVDAAIGGKTGVNLGGKNLVGVIWHPTRVLVDIDVLDALPLSLRREGLAEVLKTGLVGDPELCKLLEDRGVEAPTETVVSRAVAVKARIVSEDEREEHGKRVFLNFGHTLGHAIEFASSLSHGESVALGMIAASHISQKRVGFEDSEMVASVVDRLGLPTEVQGLDFARLLDLLERDKKRDKDGLRMVLLEGIGHPVLVSVDRSDVEVGLAAIGL